MKKRVERRLRSGRDDAVLRWENKKLKYRDKKTGQFVSRSTWSRSRARDGTRYVSVDAPAKRKREKVRTHAQAARKEPIIVERLKYQTKKKSTDIEVHRRGKKIVLVRIGKKSYSNPQDIEVLRTLIEAASPTPR